MINIGKDLKKMTHHHDNNGGCVDCPIREHTLFNGLSDKSMTWIDSHKQQGQHLLDVGALLYEENQPQDEVYILTKGWMMGYQSLSNGKRQILYFALPGDILGFKSQHKKRIEHSVQAITAVHLCVFSNENLHHVLNQETLAKQNMFNILADKMDVYHQHLLGMGQKQAEERIAFLLLDLYHRIMKQQPIPSKQPQNSVFFPLNQTHIAEATGMSVVHTNRVLQKLFNKQIIAIHQHHLILKDEQQLAALAQFDLVSY